MPFARRVLAVMPFLLKKAEAFAPWPRAFFAALNPH